MTRSRILGSSFSRWAPLFQTSQKASSGKPLLLRGARFDEQREARPRGQFYSHTMSYFAHHNYLGGEGYGSSYILEWFADFGWGGIAVGSFYDGMRVLSLCRARLAKRWFWGMVGLISAMNVFHMPRGSASEWISFIWTTFWPRSCWSWLFRGGARACLAGWNVAKGCGCRTVSAVCGRSALCSASARFTRMQTAFRQSGENENKCVWHCMY